MKFKDYFFGDKSYATVVRRPGHGKITVTVGLVEDSMEPEIITALEELNFRSSERRSSRYPLVFHYQRGFDEAESITSIVKKTKEVLADFGVETKIYSDMV